MYSKSLEQDLQEARTEIQKLSGQINHGADMNVKTTGKANK